MNFFFACICFALLLVSCGSTPKTEPYHPEKWDEIESYIRRSWPDFVEVDPRMPAPYLYGLNPGTLYYWDIYFHNEGLLRHGYYDIARGSMECMFYEIDSLGFVPNASHWGTNRSQTPFLSHSVRRYYQWDESLRDTAWLRRAYEALLKEYAFWVNADGNAIEDHSTPVAGLQRYSHHADTAELVDFFDRVLAGRFRISRDIAVERKIVEASHRMAEAECGMDFNPRFDNRCMDFIAIDLNSYLYDYEENFGWMERTLGIGNGKAWQEKAIARAKLIDEYCWNDERGFYFDYDFVNDRHSEVASVAGYMPMFFGFATRERAKRMRDNLRLFDSDGGLVVCEISPQPYDYQWGHDAVWPPVQEWVIESLTKYGFRAEAREIAMKWLNTVTKNYMDPQPATYPAFKYGDGTRRPGFIYEKYTRTGEINDYEYPCSHMLGWAASAYLVALETIRDK